MKLVPRFVVEDIDVVQYTKYEWSLLLLDLLWEERSQTVCQLAVSATFNLGHRHSEGCMSTGAQLDEHLLVDTKGGLAVLLEKAHQCTGVTETPPRRFAILHSVCNDTINK